MESIKVDFTELNHQLTEYKNVLNKNFTLIDGFKIQQFTDSALSLLNHNSDKDRKMLLNSNRIWGQKAENIYNLRKLCTNLLMPIEKLFETKIEIVCGIINNEITKKMGFNDYRQLKHGKAVIFRMNYINSFKVFLKIINSDLKFSELIYFSATDVLYIGLPTEVIKNVVKVKP